MGKVFCLRIDDDLKKQLETEAKEKGISLNTYIRILLIKRNKQ